MSRRRREYTTADQLRLGDSIITPNGTTATVDWLFQSKNVTEPHAGIHWQWPNDFTVNASHRGQSSGRIFRPGDSVTRWTRKG